VDEPNVALLDKLAAGRCQADLTTGQLDEAERDENTDVSVRRCDRLDLRERLL
jgi:hypothetical protein